MCIGRNSDFHTPERVWSTCRLTNSRSTGVLCCCPRVVLDLPVWTTVTDRGGTHPNKELLCFVCVLSAVGLL